MRGDVTRSPRVTSQGGTMHVRPSRENQMSELFEELRAVLSGRVITPEDAEYDDARRVFSGEFDRRPAAIARVADEADVARVVGFARETGLELAVRSGGHSGAGHCTTDGGIVLDLRDMKALDVDVEGQTALAQAGLTAIEYSTAAGAHGLATGFGDTGSVGIGGITLGGGVGYLVRKYGMTIDDLLAADVVTADGELLRADEDRHPDLFWAIRGGGGNFGVATRFRFRLHELDSVVGGMLMLPASAEVVAEFIALAEAAPEELSTIANVMPAPPMPFVPEEHHGKLVVLAFMCYAGETGAGERALAPFRALATPRARGCDGAGTGRRHGLRPPRQQDHGQRRLVLRRTRRQGGAPVLGGRPRRRAPAEGQRRVRQLPRRRGREADPGGLPRPDVGPPRGHQGPVRPHQPVPPEPEHPARGPQWRGTMSVYQRSRWTTSSNARRLGRRIGFSGRPAG